MGDGESIYIALRVLSSPVIVFAVYWFFFRELKQRLGTVTIVIGALASKIADLQDSVDLLERRRDV